MKLRISWYWLWFLIPLLLLFRAYFQTGVPFTHDGENHLARFASYKIALREGQFPPRFAPNLMNHYGYPVFNYNYPLANILSVPLSLMKISYEITFKVLAVAGVALGIWGVVAWLKACGFSRSARFFAAGVFVLSPFIANLILVRGSIGEVWALGLFPWLLWLTKKLKRGEPVKLFVSTAIMTAFFLSHNVSVLFGGALWLLYVVAKFRKDWVLWRALCAPMLLALGLSLWFWLPALAEKNLIVLDADGLSSQYAAHFVEPLQLITSPLSFGYSYSVPVDTMSFSVGLGGAVSLMVMTVWLMKRKSVSEKRQSTWLWFFVAACWALLFLQTPLSSVLWRTMPLVSFIQFPWRLTLFFIVFVLPLVATVFEMSRNLRRVAWLCVVFQAVALWRFLPADMLHKTNLDYDAFTQSTSTANENRVKGFEYTEIADWQPAPSVVSGEATAEVEKWTGSSRRYRLTVQNEALIVEPTMVFAGWETMANGERVTYADPAETQGRLGYRLMPGEYTVESHFTQNTWPRIVGNSVTVGTAAVLGWLVWREYQKSSGK